MKSIRGINLLFFFGIVASCSKEKVSPQPYADFNYSSHINCFDGSVEVWFNITSTNASNYLWSFGDSTSSGERNPQKIYRRSGTYQVSLMAFAQEKSAVTVQEIIIKTKVIGNRPMADFDATRSNPNNLEFTVINKSSGATSYQVDFGDGSVVKFDSFDKTLHTYSGPGLYIITLYTFGNEGCNYASKRIVI